MLSRRELVGRVAAGAAAICVAGGARASLKPVARDPVAPNGAGGGDDATAAVPPRGSARVGVVDEGPPATLGAPPPWEWFRPLALGSAVGHGWQLAGLTGAVDGSCVLTLENQRGRAHRVHVCRNDGRPQGLVYTQRFDLVVMNGGQGDLPTEEGLAQAVAEVAHVLAANEGDRRGEPVVTALLPHAERLRLFAGSADRRLR